MDSGLEKLLDQLNTQNKIIIDHGKKMLETYGLFTFDFFCMAVLNRSVNLIRGYILLVKDNNFIAAGSLVRLHLDSLLRIFAPGLINYNIDDFAKKIMKRINLRNLVDAENNKMTDKYLATKLSKIKKFKWVEKLYDVGNHYIHLSEKHIFTSSRLGKKPRTIEGGIRLTDEFITQEEKIAATNWMLKISDGIIYFIDLWISQKESYYHQKK